jgi:hypothetical protein
MSADELPRFERDATNLVRHPRRQCGWASRDGSEILLAARVPFRSVGHDRPEPFRHRREVDLRDRQHHVADDTDVQFPSLDVSLDDHLVETDEHGFDARLEGTRRPHDRSLFHPDGRILGRRFHDRRVADAANPAATPQRDPGRYWQVGVRQKRVDDVLSQAHRGRVTRTASVGDAKEL